MVKATIAFLFYSNLTKKVDAIAAIAIGKASLNSKRWFC